VNVSFGSKADICAVRHVRFTPDNDRESGFPQRGMSAYQADIENSENKDRGNYFMAGMLPLSGIFICISAGIAVPPSFWKVGSNSGVVITNAP